MRRSAPPPDFRYVGLEEGPSRWWTLVVPSALGVVTFAAAIGASGGHLDLLVLSIAAALGAVVAWMAARRLRFGHAVPSAERTAMAVVPWGVLVQSSPDPRVLHWPAVKEVDVTFVHEMDNATPSIRWSIVTVRTERNIYCGRAPGAVPLEQLDGLLEQYTLEASGPAALDLDGERAVEEISLEPTFEQLHSEAIRLLHSGAAAERLSLPPSSYRAPGGIEPTIESIAELREVLSGGTDSEADPRALAAIVAAELGATELLPDVMRLTTSPNALVAAIARAASLRLGGDAKNVGAVSEVAEFLAADDVRQIEAWLEAPRPSFMRQKAARVEATASAA